jgi:hypothetical protein
MTAMTPTQDLLETQSLTLAEQAKALVISDQRSYELAAERLRGVAELRRQIIAHHQPIKQAARAAWERAIEAERWLLDPITTAENLYKTRIAAYEAEQRRIEAEKLRQAENEARLKAEAERERELEQAENEGADAEEIAAMINEPLIVMPPRVEPTFQPPKGVSTATTWKGECTSLSDLTRAVAAGQAPPNLVMPNETAINALARAVRNTLAIPGLKFYSVANVRAGRI